MSGPIHDQPPPVPMDGPSMHDLVIADLVERKRVGLERYGTTLQAHNGRDSLVDAYQEALDLVAYLRQHIAEDWRGRALRAEAWRQQVLTLCVRGIGAALDDDADALAVANCDLTNFLRQALKETPP